MHPKSSQDFSFTNRIDSADVRYLVQVGSAGVLDLGAGRRTWHDCWNPDQTGVGFVGRAEELARLVEALSDPDGVARIQSVGGIGGIGKTALSVAYGNRFRREFDGLVFHDFHSYGSTRPDTANDALVAILPVVCGRPAAEVNALGYQERLTMWRAATAARRLLMVWDNVRSCDQVEPLLIRGEGCATIITSRDRIAVESALPPIRLDVLDPATATAMFERIAGDGHGRDQVEELVRRDLYVPVLIHSHARAVSDGSPIGEVVADLPTSATDVDLGSFDDLFDRLDGSYRHLRTDEQRAFRAFCAHPGRAVTLGSLAAAMGCSIGTARNLMEALRHAGLAERPHAGAGSPVVELRTYTAHDMIRAFGARLSRQVASEDGSNTESDEIGISLVTHYRLQLSRYDNARKEWFGMEAESILAVVLSGESPDHGYLALAAGIRARLLGRFDIATACLEHAAATTGSLQAHIELGYVALRKEAYEAAETHFHQVLAWATATADRRWPARIRALPSRFSTTAAAQIREHLGEVTATRLRMDAATAQAGLGEVALRQGSLEVADDRFKAALNVFTETGSWLGIGNAHWYLGELALQRGELATAVHHFEAVLDIFTRNGKMSGAADARLGLGTIAIHRGDLDSADQYFGAAIELFESEGNQTGRGSALRSLAKIAALRGDDQLAMTKYEEAIEVFDRIDLRHLSDQVRADVLTLKAALGPRSRWDTCTTRLVGGGEVDHEPRLALGSVLNRYAAAVPPQGFTGDREPQAGTAGVPAPCFVQPTEPLEDPLPVPRRNAGAVVSDRQLRYVVGLGERDRHPRCGVPLGIVDQVADRPDKLIRVTGHLGAGEPGEVERHAPGGPEAADHPEHQIVQIDRLGTAVTYSRIGPRQLQHVLYQRLQPCDLRQHLARFEITGSELESASEAALSYLGEGEVTATEVGDEESYYEVEVTMPDGRQVDVQLDEQFQVVGAEGDEVNR